MTRRVSRLINAVFVSVALLAATVHAGDRGSWERFKHDFISPDGRVIDSFQRGISHSEGQGYAMLLAVSYNDEETFRLCREWAADNLQVRMDGLFAWSWGERTPGQWGVIDMNNASDGDLLIAFAMLLGAKKWKDSPLQDNALEIVKSIRKNLVVEHDNRLFLLPGYYGFLENDGIVLNPAYMVFPAYSLFSEYEGPEFWQRMHRDGLEILKACTFTRLKLPADWVLWKGPAPSLFSRRSDLYGYEAIRVLLYLAWDHNVQALEGTGNMLRLVHRLGYVPLHVDLVGSAVSLEDAPAGIYAIYARAADAQGRSEQSKVLWKEARKRIKKEKDNYYSHVLYLLSEIQPIPLASDK